jgi:putative FmdB family regulatory protein
MPTYDYICGACSHHAEIFHSMADKPREKCPACGKLKLERQIGLGGGVIFKGSGFYETDYRSDSYREGETSAQSKGDNDEPSKSIEKSSESTDSSKG